MNEPSEFSESSNSIYRDGEREKAFQPAAGNEQNIGGISKHFEFF